MWNVWQWAVASNERAVANAREAAVHCSRARLERSEVELYLSQLHGPRQGMAVLSAARTGTNGG